MTAADEPGFSTLSIHAGARPDPTTGARVTPIYQTTAFVFDDVDHAAALFGLQAFGNIYTRITNPTTAALEERVAALEGAPAALAVASGHAAQMVVFHTLMQPGDEFVASTKLYGGSINQFNHAFKNFGWNVRWADPDDLGAVRGAITDKTKAIFVESIANPGGVVTDIAGFAAIAKQAKVPLIVDNTLASPYLIRPVEHGADIVVHSATKYLCGHGNSMGGIIVDGGVFEWLGDPRYPMLSAPRPEYGGMTLAETFGNFGFAMACRALSLRDLGPAISPFNAFLILTGIETLSLRMQRHCDNALAVARHLAAHPAVGWVSYAGLRESRYYELAQRYAPKGAGGVLTFGVNGGYEAGVALVARLRLFSHVANIGDVRSLVIHPASTTHRQLAEAQKIAAGAGPEVVRLSIGLEDVADLLADLDQALA
ncbi:MAG: O-acetylhomoserine aminocarboxypropyltransferase [Bradyrhizobium sp.]|nr:MAG: O-acetylhomoserine aminocarboxypropyltransferase [Bradyrhizobium sp.]